MPITITEDDVEAAGKRDFGPVEEKTIISLAFDSPEFFSTVMPYLKPEYFQLLEAKIVFALIKFHFERDQVLLTRELCLDIYESEHTADDPYEEIKSLILRESNPREVPVVINKLIEWTKRKAYGRLYEEEAIQAHDQGNYEEIEKIIEEANRISKSSATCHFFFDKIEELFAENAEIKLTCGFPDLDKYINEGGPIKKDVFCWMAPTGVGKSIALINSGAACIKRKLNVLHVTCEMTFLKTALRYLGCFTEIPIRERKNYKSNIAGRLATIKATYGSELIIVEFPPDEISVDVIHALLDSIRKIHGIKIDVVVIDYLELLVSRVPANNKEEYTKQKRVSTEVSRLAVKEDVLVFTASQTNRSGNEDESQQGNGPRKALADPNSKVIGISKMAESYGKAMPLSYIVTINQTKNEYEQGIIKDKNNPDAPPRVTNALARFHIVKNRNGPKNKTINARINYETMKMEEVGYINSKTTTDAVKKEAN